MQPWMGALEDNLEVLNNPDPSGGDWGRSATMDLMSARIRVKSLSFMRGRTFIKKFLIIDEAQNLTPKANENPHHPCWAWYQGGVPG